MNVNRDRCVERDVRRLITTGAYYYAINVKTAYIPITGGGILGVVALSHPNPGTPMRPEDGGISFATYKLNTLDGAGAAAEMAKLDVR
ncbi:MAG TPA: hypothetical protein VH684_04290 [Xanthobacteraceae bacterium]|jgi:hypothetical protein